jgi:hypothetical protein
MPTHYGTATKDGKKVKVTIRDKRPKKIEKPEKPKPVEKKSAKPDKPKRKVVIKKKEKKPTKEMPKTAMKDGKKVKVTIVDKRPKKIAPHKDESNQKDLSKGFKGVPTRIGYDKSADDLDAKFDPKSMVLEMPYKPASFPERLGESFVNYVNSKAMRNINQVQRKGDKVYLQFRKQKQGDYLMASTGFILGQLGDGAEDRHGHNVVPFLKEHAKVKYYAVYPDSSFHVKQFIKGYSKGGRINFKSVPNPDDTQDAIEKERKRRSQK